MKTAVCIVIALLISWAALAQPLSPSRPLPVNCVSGCSGSGSIPAGTNIIGKVGIDQTTPGTTNGMAIVGVNGSTALAGAGATGAGSLRLTIAQDPTTLGGSALGLTSGSPLFASITNTPSVTISGTPAVTATGSVTANAGTNLNTSLLALESGGNLATLAGGVSTSVYQENTKQWAGSALGAMANYGTSPGAVLVPGVNAFITNSPTVTAQFSTNNSATTPHICGSHVFKHITTATDTQIVAASGSTTVYVCDYSISFNGTGNIYLEKATSGTCATLTQIDQAWYGIANAGKIDANPYYRGLNTGSSAQLCANTSANVTIDISVSYDQY